jgi:hypothetical protein
MAFLKIARQTFNCIKIRPDQPDSHSRWVYKSKVAEHPAGADRLEAADTDDASGCASGPAA